MGSVQNFLADNHERVEDLLELTIGEQTKVDHDVSKEFRSGLLRCIMMGEQVLFLVG